MVEGGHVVLNQVLARKEPMCERFGYDDLAGMAKRRLLLELHPSTTESPALRK
jgi:hypothetical protein